MSEQPAKQASDQDPSRTARSSRAGVIHARRAVFCGLDSLLPANVVVVVDDRRQRAVGDDVRYHAAATGAASECAATRHRRRTPRRRYVGRCCWLCEAPAMRCRGGVPAAAAAAACSLQAGEERWRVVSTTVALGTSRGR
ncbi:unnamed protein product [Ixodes pacificus]